MKAVFPHGFKMTETNPVPSLSMSASLPLILIEQVPKGLYQATDWRDGGQSSRRTATRPPPYVYNHPLKVLLSLVNNNINQKGDIHFGPIAPSNQTVPSARGERKVLTN